MCVWMMLDSLGEAVWLQKGVQAWGSENVLNMCFEYVQEEILGSLKRRERQLQEPKKAPGRRPEKHRPLFKVGKTAQTCHAYLRHSGGCGSIYLLVWPYLSLGVAYFFLGGVVFLRSAPGARPPSGSLCFF